MSCLLDVSFLVALGWSSHADHAATIAAVDRMPGFCTCAATQMGFLRVSLSPAFRSSFAEAIKCLETMLASPRHSFLADETAAADLPAVGNRQEVTDAHLVTLAKRHGLKLATLDKALCAKPWAAGVAFNPLTQAPAP